MKMFNLTVYFDKRNIQVQSLSILFCGSPAPVSLMYEFK